MSSFPHGPDWLAYLAQEIGTDKWCIASRLTAKLRDKGYTRAINHVRYAEIEAAYNTLQANAKAERIAFMLYWRDTRPPAIISALDPEAWAERIRIIRAALTAEGLL